MKKLPIIMLLMSSLLASGCMYDDLEIRNQLDEMDDRVSKLENMVQSMNSDIDGLQRIVEALENNVTIDKVVKGKDGYAIYFSNGEIAEIKDGSNGANAPVISVKQDEDGLWYWTSDGEWLIVDGEKIRAEGVDGEKGDDAIAPQVRINPDTKMWEISTDGGQEWESTGVVAEGKDAGSSGEGSCIFKDVDYSGNTVVFTLSDGNTITVPKTIDAVFEIEGVQAGSVQTVVFGKTRTYDVKMNGVLSFMIAKPDGWRANLDVQDSTLAITAPVKENAYAETRGTVSISIVSETGATKIAMLEVEASDYELRVLTFEDEDYKGGGNYLGNKDWSSLIDDTQYGGPLLYGETGFGPSDYCWWDENNTFLAHEFPENWGTTCYMGGGHAVSDYVETDMANADYLHQLAVYYKDPVTGFGGHGGSKNFCVHYGYADDSGFSMSELPAIYFKDNTARVIDHMYVMWNAYLANSIFNGNSLTEPVGPDGYVKIVAMALDEALEPDESNTVEFFIASAEGNIEEWTKWDLSSLGKVYGIAFNMAGDSDNGYGFSQPAYFCYDDVAVRFE